MKKEDYEKMLNAYVRTFRNVVLPKIFPEISDESLKEDGVDIEMEDHISVNDAFGFLEIKDDNERYMCILGCRPFIPEHIRNEIDLDIMCDYECESPDLFAMAVRSMYAAMSRHIFVTFENTYCLEVV